MKDAKTFASSECLNWLDGGRRNHMRGLDELKEFIGERLQPGRVVPLGFAKNGRLG